MRFKKDFSRSDQRKGPALAPYRKVARSVRQIVAGRTRDGNQFGQRIAPGLSRFTLDGIEDLAVALQNEVVEPSNHRRAFIEG